MNYFELETTQLADPDFVCLGDLPAEIMADKYRMAEGEAMGSDFPADARIEMGPETHGITLGTILSNVFSLLMVHRDLKEVLAGTGVPMECLPFTLIDHKKRVASRDYFIVNPFGTFDCIDDKASVIEYFEDDPSVIVDVERLVLDPKKLEQAPDFFRIDRQPRKYVVSERLAARIAALNPTNVSVHRLEQSKS